MSARNVSHQQLAMWYTGNELKSMTQENTRDRRPEETNEDMWARKTEEARTGKPSHARTRSRGATLMGSVRRSGVSKPVRVMREMGKDVLLDGHHRVAAAAAVDPNMLIPVTHHEDNVQYEK